MNSGRLEVTEELLDRVVYGMENQKDRLMLDPLDGQLKEKSLERRDLIPMPSWGPSEGYRLMDRFAATLPATPFQDRLTDILHSGSGVFRRFKDSLKERPEMEDLWRRFKQREMRKAALSWLSRWSEALELEALGPEPEDWEELTLGDFVFRATGDSDESILSDLRNQAAAERPAGIPRSLMPPAFSPEGGRPEADSPAPAESFAFLAEAPDGTAVGYAELNILNRSAGAEGVLRSVHILEEFRGLGIGRHLMSMAFDKASELKLSAVSLMSGSVQSDTGTWLEAEGYSPVAVWWRKG